MILSNHNVGLAHRKIHGLMEQSVPHVFIQSTGIKLPKIVSNALMVESIITQLVNVNVKLINSGLAAAALNAISQDFSMIIVNSV